MPPRTRLGPPPPSLGAPPATPPRSVRADGAAFTYAGAQRPAFRDLELRVEPGQLLLVVGPSGSGKSTVARALAGLLPMQFPGEWQGSVSVGSVNVARAELEDDVAPVTTAGLGVGIVLQDPASQLVMERVGDDVAFGLENLAWPMGAMRARVPEALGWVGLGGFEGRRSTRLSGGEQQRVAIAGVLAQAPGLLVLDEPTANLDPAGAATVFRILAELQSRRAATIVLVEHRAELAWPIADVVLALDDDGRPIDVGPPADVLARSASKLERAGVWLPESGAAAAARAQASGAPSMAGASADATPSASLPIVEMAAARFGFEPAFPVLRSVDLRVAQGERIALVGVNGSGKTTLLRLALGLLRPIAGEVRLGGRDPWRMPGMQLSRLAGYVVQDPELGFLADTVREEVEIGLEAGQLAYAHELCDRLRLPLGDFGDRSPYQLSGGEQRRLSLVTGLARRPLLLALDEPTYGQDRRGHEALVEALDELVGEGSAMLAATHDERFVRDAADRRVELADGWVASDDAVPARGGAAS
ncbi:MAG TPA: ATP-binding cassette domain-containing protein [Solirubrobacteraceae bacterium]|nr:ATP-binding cassette domain-containing protein [Solirubrobacteraceae bacterium]